MGFDPRQWRPAEHGPRVTTNIEALLAENEALRREVCQLRRQLELSRTAADLSEPAAPGPRSRVTRNDHHGLSRERLLRWGEALAAQPGFTQLRLGPPAGLKGLLEELRRHWWDPSLTLAQELDRRTPGLGSDLEAALGGRQSRQRWALRCAFALYGPRATEWLQADPRRVVEELLRRCERLEHRQADHRRRGTRTANHSHAHRQSDGGEGQRQGQSADGRRTAPNGRASAAGADRANQARQDRKQRQRPGEGASGDQRRSSQRPGEPAAADPLVQAWQQLGLEAGASEAEIKRAYRRLAKSHHPDLGGASEAFQRLQAAYQMALQAAGRSPRAGR